MAKVGDIWTRFVDVTYEDGEVRVLAVPYSVVKVTRCGVRLDSGRFVPLVSRKRFACATVEEAWASFVQRKRHHAAILRAQLRRVERALELAERRETE